VAPFNSNPSLVVISGAGRDRQIPIPVSGIVLGRDAHLGAPFSTDQFVSRSHASVQRRGDGVEIADLGSANGTYVNGALVHAPAPLRDGDVLRIGGIELKLPAAASAPATMNYRVDGQYGQVIHNVGRDQNNSYLIQQRENFLRQIAATKTKARWLIWTGFVSFVAGSAIFAAGALGFIKRVSGDVSTGAQPREFTAFGRTVHGIPSGLIGSSIAALGVLLIIVGIVLHIVATSRRRRVDRELPAGPWLGADRAGRTM
jgi:FHA domain